MRYREEPFIEYHDQAFEGGNHKHFQNCNLKGKEKQQGKFTYIEQNTII